MRKINRTVLVYSSSNDELGGLRSVIEPVVLRYRQATSYAEACSKSSNEKIDFVVLSTSTSELREYMDFLPFCKVEPNLKKAKIFVWAPPSPDEIFPEFVKFFEKGQYEELVAGFSADEVDPDRVIEKTKVALPTFMEHFIGSVADEVGKALGVSLYAKKWKYAVLDKARARVVVVVNTRLLEGYCVLCSPANITSTPETLKDAIRAASLGAAKKNYT